MDVIAAELDQCQVRMGWGHENLTLTLIGGCDYRWVDPGQAKDHPRPSYRRYVARAGGAILAATETEEKSVIRLASLWQQRHLMVPRRRYTGHEQNTLVYGLNFDGIIHFFAVAFGQ